MQLATTIAQWTVRITGIIQVAVGLLFWNGRALPLLNLHMLIGMIFVLALWALAGLAARAGLRPVLVLLAVSWGIVIPVLGMTQQRLLPGPAHWVIQVLHLLVGLVAMVVAARLARFVRQHPRNRVHGRRTAAIPSLPSES